MLNKCVQELQEGHIAQAWGKFTRQWRKELSNQSLRICSASYSTYFTEVKSLAQHSSLFWFCPISFDARCNSWDTPNGCSPDGNSALLALPDFWQPQLNNTSSVLLYGCNIWNVSYLKSLCAWACPKISTVCSHPAFTVLHGFRHQRAHMDTHNLPWDQGREWAAWLLPKYMSVLLHLMPQLEEQETSVLCTYRIPITAVGTHHYIEDMQYS